MYLDIRNHAGATLETFLMDEPTITFRLSDIGGFTSSIAFSDPGLSQDLIGPKRTDYRIKYSYDGGASFYPIQGGFCWTVGLKTGDYKLPISGVDWLAWLDQPYHFPAYEDYLGSPATDRFLSWVNASQQTIIEDILDGMFNSTGETINLIPSFDGTGWLNNIPTHDIMMGDTTTALDMVKGVGGLVDPYGFDFVCDYNRTVYFYAPKRVTVDSAIPIATFTPTNDTGLIEIDWENKGPKATATVGTLAAGIPKYYSYEPSRVQFRKWLEIVSLNETYRNDAIKIQQATNDIGGMHSNPQKSNTITILPEYMDPFDETTGFLNHCGRVVYVDSEDHFLPAHRIDAPYVVTMQELFKVDKNWHCRMTLDQIYAID